jgi:NADPH:quinone reductase-like Zn-dependent oxidoreductase
LAVQVAKALGGVVVGVCSSRNLELVRGLGADEVVDYTKPEPYQGQAPFDAIYDCVGGDYAKYMPLLTPKGRYASSVPGPGVIGRSLLNWASARAVKPVMLKASTADLKWLDELFVQGKLKVVEDSRFALAELSKAWERSQSGRAVGKILIEI